MASPRIQRILLAAALAAVGALCTPLRICRFLESATWSPTSTPPGWADDPRAIAERDEPDEPGSAAEN